MPVTASHLSTERTGICVDVVELVLGLDDVGQLGAVDLVALGDDLAAALGRDVAGRDAAEEVVVRLARLVVHGQLDELLGAAVGLADDHVLRDVDQTPRQVSGVGGTQGGVGEALAGAVGRDEVLEHRQAFHEVGLDRALDDLALRVGHQATHARQLADLLERATGTRVGHHEDGVQLVEVLLHRLGDLVGRLVPLLDDSLVALLLR